MQPNPISETSKFPSFRVFTLSLPANADGPELTPDRVSVPDKSDNRPDEVASRLLGLGVNQALCQGLLCWSKVAH